MGERSGRLAVSRMRDQGQDQPRVLGERLQLAVGRRHGASGALAQRRFQHRRHDEFLQRDAPVRRYQLLQQNQEGRALIRCQAFQTGRRERDQRQARGLAQSLQFGRDRGHPPGVFAACAQQIHLRGQRRPAQREHQAEHGLLRAFDIARDLARMLRQRVEERCGVIHVPGGNVAHRGDHRVGSGFEQRLRIGPGAAALARAAAEFVAPGESAYRGVFDRLRRCGRGARHDVADRHRAAVDALQPLSQRRVRRHQPAETRGDRFAEEHVARRFGLRMVDAGAAHADLGERPAQAVAVARELHRGGIGEEFALA